MSILNQEEVRELPPVSSQLDSRPGEDPDLEQLFDDNAEVINNPNGDDENNATEEEMISDAESKALFGFESVDDRGVGYKREELLGSSGYGESQYDQGATVEEIRTGLDKRRAILQPWEDQLGNAVAQAVVGEIVGGTIEGVGYLLDWVGMADLAQGTESEYTNWLSDIGKGLREKTQDATKIYEMEPGKMNMSDSGYWFKNSVSVASTLSMMLPSMAAAKGLGFLGRGASKLIGRGMSKGAKVFGKELSKEAFDVATKMGIKSEWMAQGISQAVVSRHIENSMEASGTFEEIYEERLKEINPKTKKVFTEDEARQSAADGAAENYKHGWAMLAQDMVQYLSIGKVFNPVTRKMVSKQKAVMASVKPKWLEKTLAVGGTFLSEAGEEGYQHFIASRAGLNSKLNAGLISQQEYDRQFGEIMKSDEAMTSMLFGGLGGSVFSAAGPRANQIFKSKSKKEFEEMAGQLFNEGLANRNKQYAALQVQKNKADVSGSQEEIQASQDALILSMVLDGIDSDNLEMTMEAIKNGPELTKEEIEQFGEENGFEWDPAVAKAGAERALEVAQQVKEIHFRNREKASNKNVSPNIVKDMTRIEFQNNEFEKRFKGLKKENKKRIEDLKFDSFLGPMDNFMKDKDLEAQIRATEIVMKKHQEMLDATLDESQKEDRKQIIKSHNANLARLKKERGQVQASDRDPRTGKSYLDADQKLANEKAEKVYNDGVKEEVALGYIKEMYINDLMTQNQLDLGRLHDKSFQKALVNKRTIDAVNNTTDVDALKKLKEQIEKKEMFGESTKKERKELQEGISKRIAALETEKRREKKEEEDKKTIDEQNRKAAEKNKANEELNNNVTHPVVDGVEDEHEFEEALIEENLQDKSEEHTEIVTGNGKTVSPLDDNENTSAPYRQWIHNGLSKIGTIIKYASHNRGSFMAPRYANSDRKKAHNAFNNIMKAKKSGINSSVPQNVYDHLPIGAYVGEAGSSIYTVMPSFPLKKAKETAEQYQENVRKYQENYAAERKHIIDAMIANNGVAETTITHTGGGELQIQPSVNGAKVENNISDLKQVIAAKKKGEGPRIVFSNIDGKLMELDETKNTIAEEFRKMNLSAGKDSEGKPVPYKGGLFLVLKKADGTPFPVRLNHKNNTREQAELLADILLDVGVAMEVKGKKKYDLSLPLSQVDPNMIEKIKDVMGPEIKMLGADPTLSEIINSFVHLNERTEGLKSQLYLKYGNLYFGGIKNNISPETRQSKRNDLVKFLVEEKKRQFSIKMWNDTENYPGYRDFVIENGIINTNVVVGQDEFQSSNPDENKKVKRRVQIYMAPLAPVASSKPTEVAESKGNVVGTVVDSNNSLPSDSSTNIDEQVGPSLTEINKAIRKKFKGIFWEGSKYVRLNGKEVTAQEVQELDKIKNELQSEFDANKKKLEEATVSAKEEEVISEMTPEEASLKEARDQLDFEIERLDDIDTSEEANIASKEEVSEKKRQARERYVQKVQEIKKEYAPAPVTPAQPTQQTSKVETKKADIEKRRKQEKIDSEVNSMSETQDFILERRKKIDAKYNAELAALEGTTPANDFETNEAKIEELRDQEQNELLDAIDNAENYLTNGKVDKNKINNLDDLNKFQEIYDKYDKLISPLMGEETSPANETSTTKKIFDVMGDEEMGYDVMELTEDGLITDGQGSLSKEEAEEYATKLQYDSNKESQQSSDTQISKKKTKDLPLKVDKPIIFEPTYGSMIGGSNPRARQIPDSAKVITDENINPTDEKEKINCSKGGQTKLDF